MKAIWILIGSEIRKVKCQPPALSSCSIEKLSATTQKTSHCCTLLHWSQIYSFKISSQKSYLAKTFADRAWTYETRPTTCPNQCIKQNTCVQAIHNDLKCEKPKGEDVSIKGDIQRLITLAHNPIFHTLTNIDIQHYFIRDEFAIKRIELGYIPIVEMIVDGQIKPLTNAKFHTLVK